MVEFIRGSANQIITRLMKLFYRIYVISECFNRRSIALLLPGFPIKVYPVFLSGVGNDVILLFFRNTSIGEFGIVE